MNVHRSSPRSLFERVLVACAQLVLFCLAMPAILLAVLAGGLVAVLAGLLSTVGLTQALGGTFTAAAGLAGALKTTPTGI